MRTFPALLVLIGCSDTFLNQVDDQKGTVDTEDTFDPEIGETGYPDDGTCEAKDFPAEAVAKSDVCDEYEIGQFEPEVKWEVDGYCASQPLVGDLDGDGMPEVIINRLPFILSTGDIYVYRGDTGALVWNTTNLETGMGAHPAIADVDNDGHPEIFVVKQYQTSLFGSGEFSVVRLDWEGNQVAESEHFVEAEFDYAAAVAIADMDHDGTPEIVVGRAILTPDLETRGTGDEGRGCDALVNLMGMYGEGSNPGIADMDLDGQQEVVVGNAYYDADGRTTLNIRGGKDGAVAIANFDSDPEAEFVRVTYNELEAYDTDGTTLWGPLTNKTANILSIPGIADVDNDGLPEIVTAGGNMLWVLNAEDGSMLWQANVHDESGATGGSFFDFDADGILEIVYIDEVEMIAFNGTDGTVKFHSTDHASDTMYDYPTIADVDADGHADIVVAHDQNGKAISVYSDATLGWAPTRGIWNQHAYTVTNVNDDLSIPTTAVENFTDYNTFHAAEPIAFEVGEDLESEIVDVCLQDCDKGYALVTGRGRNTSTTEMAAGIVFSLYAQVDGHDTLIGVATTTTATPALTTTEALAFTVDASDLVGADSLWLVVDDDGTGTGAITECLENNNGSIWKGPFCE